MGYYSDFHVDDTDIPNVKEVLNNLTEHYEWYDYTDENQPYLAGVKWYEWLTDLDELARLYPTNYLVIIRYGEDQPDITRAVVAKGTVTHQKAEITWPGE